MGTITINPVSVALAGVKITKADTDGTAGSIIVAPTTAQSSLNFEDLFVVVENYSTTASCVVTVKAGDNYSEVGIGAASVTIATATTKVIGGKELESARFKDKNGYLNLDITTTAASCYVYAIMQPFTILNPK